MTEYTDTVKRAQNQSVILPAPSLSCISLRGDVSAAVEFINGKYACCDKSLAANSFGEVPKATPNEPQIHKLGRKERKQLNKLLAASAPAEHREHVSPAGLSNEWFALVHQPVPANEMLTNKGSVKALEKESTKFEGKDAWKIVAEEARKTGRNIHFGR